MTQLSDADRLYIAERAKTLLEDRVLAQAWGDIEVRYISEMLQPDATDEDRRKYADRVNALREVREDLVSMVNDGKQVERKTDNRLP